MYIQNKLYSDDMIPNHNLSKTSTNVNNAVVLCCVVLC